MPTVLDSTTRTRREAEHGAAATIRRVGSVLGTLDLDCTCRERMEDALARFAELEEMRTRRERLDIARRELALVEGLCGLLVELHEIGAAEPDRSVYAELERLFLDVAEAASRGAAAMRTAHVEGARP